MLSSMSGEAASWGGYPGASPWSVLPLLCTRALFLFSFSVTSREISDLKKSPKKSQPCPDSNICQFTLTSFQMCMDMHVICI